MADHPIPFSAPMIDAILAGRKTQTRRIISPQPPEGVVRHCWYSAPQYGFTTDPDQPTADWHVVRLAAQPGDRLWVRESYFQFGHWAPIAGARTKGGRQKWGFVADSSEIRFDAPAEYRKGMHNADPATPAWHKRLGRFMPRRASRLTLTVTDVRVECLQDCSEDDAISEGIHCENVIVGMACYGGPPCETTADRYFFDGCDDEGFEDGVSAYAALWDAINGEGAWAANPWIVAYTFTVARGNIDALDMEAA